MEASLIFLLRSTLSSVETRLLKSLQYAFAVVPSEFSFLSLGEK